MLYIIYKSESDKEIISNYINKINNYLYKKDNLEGLSQRLVIINRSSVNNYELLTRIEVDKNECHDENNNMYYKFYDIDDNNVELKKMIGIITYLKSVKKDSKYFGLFYNSLIKDACNNLSDNKEEKDVLDKITELGLIAFSNKSNTLEGNDLINSFLNNQKEIENKYNEIMGEGSFDVLNELCQNLELHYIFKNNISDYEFREIITSLKKYFDLKLNISNIPSEDKQIMISNFNKLYNKLESEYLNKNKKTL